MIDMNWVFSSAVVYGTMRQADGEPPTNYSSNAALEQVGVGMRERVVTCGSSHHLRWYEPPQNEHNVNA
jgi:hypothetical protein